MASKITSETGHTITGDRLKVTQLRVDTLLLFLSSMTNPSLQGVADRFFGLAVILITVVVILAIAGLKVKFP